MKIWLKLLTWHTVKKNDSKFCDLVSSRDNILSLLWHHEPKLTFIDFDIALENIKPARI